MKSDICCSSTPQAQSALYRSATSRIAGIHVQCLRSSSLSLNKLLHDRPDKNVLYVMFCPSLTCSNIAQHNSTGNRFEKLHRHIKKRQTNCLKRCSIPFFQTIEADVSHDRLDITCWPLLTCSGITWHNNTGNLMEKSHRHVQKHHINWWSFLSNNRSGRVPSSP